MGFLLLLKCALLCIDFLAWPVIALGYPVFASIRAIESGSKYHMRKLVIYWTLFSLISLFEFAFVKIIEWIPFWSSIKLIAIFLLAIPRFDGACYAYQIYIHPCLAVNLQEVIRRFEEQCRTKETVLDDVADKYTKENGFEASEKLIATKKKCKELDNSQRDTQLIESDEKNDASTAKQLKEPVTYQKDNEMLEAPEKSAATDEAKQAQPVTKETTYAAVVTKGIIITPTQTLIPEKKQPPPPLKKVEPAEWTCPLCRVTTTCENNLNDHLRGKNHKSMCESLKSSKLNAQDTRPGSSTGRKDVSKKKSCKTPQERVKNQKSKTQQHWCFLCDVGLSGEVNLASHLKGKRHMSNVETMGIS